MRGSHSNFQGDWEEAHCSSRPEKRAFDSIKTGEEAITFTEGAADLSLKSTASNWSGMFRPLLLVGCGSLF